MNISLIFSENHDFESILYDSKPAVTVLKVSKFRFPSFNPRIMDTKTELTNQHML
ncbi:hypothetical protein Hanom_Chr00s011813g01748141 [Helianthus anomalus]